MKRCQLRFNNYLPPQKKLELTEAQEVLKIIDKFEEDDDIQNVFHNLELTDEIIAQLENSQYE